MKKTRYPNIYIALAVSLAAVGIGTVVSMRAAKTKIKADPGSAETFSRVTVKWYDPEDIPVTNRANAAVTGIHDERTEYVPDKLSDGSSATISYGGYEKTDGEETGKASSPDEENDKSGFVLPMGKDIIKDYSDGEMVRSKTMNDWRIHNGIDFGGSAGNTVYAAADGTVTASYDDEFWGGVVEVDHGSGVTVKYCGLDFKSCPDVGNNVFKGKKLGTLGTVPSEKADGDHLHVEVIIGKKIADPLEIFGYGQAE